MKKVSKQELCEQIDDMANDSGDGCHAEFLTELLRAAFGYEVTIVDVKDAIKLLLADGKVVQDKYGAIIGTMMYPNTAARVRAGHSICGPD